MKMKNCLLITVLLLGAGLSLTGGFVTPAKALTEPTSLTNVVAQVYPEYDDLLQLNTPSLLVMIHGQAGPDTALPATIRFLIPSTARLYSAGSLDSSGQYTGTTPFRNPSEEVSGWDEVSYEIATITFILEYYDPVIGEQPDKVVNFDFRPLYNVVNLELIMQEPLTSSNFSVNPAPDSSFPSVDNYSGKQFNYHQFSRSGLVSGDVVNFAITYTKTDLAPSVTAPANTSSGNGGVSWVKVVGIIFGVLIIIGIVVFFALRIRSNNRGNQEPSIRPSQTDGTGKSQFQDKYCGNCRQPFADSDEFCSNCGAKRN